MRPLLFLQEAESAHSRALRLLGRASRSLAACGVLESLFDSPKLPVKRFGLSFPNPVGLAAGMDKYAEAVPAWASLGFGFSELGGVTWHAQPGNDKPRLFRAVGEEAIVNRMGFNNPGAEALAQKLADWRKLGRWPTQHPVGINLGKSKGTPLDKAAEDYANSFRVLRAHADFFVVNVSSPNTPGLRQLQDKSALDEILAAIQSQQAGETLLASSDAAGAIDRSFLAGKPILIKVAPDLTFEALDDILDLTTTRHVAGIIATNTTIDRPETKDVAAQKVYAETGGLSGRPLRARSTEVIRHLYRQTQGKLPIIGVGGIFNVDDAWEKIVAGASLVQVYTGLIYEGPGIAKSIVNGLRELLARENAQGLSGIVGREAG
jgi:dihydroorotate dehydrogenase